MNVAAIDVIVPIYNAAETLDESLDSIARQSFTDFRVIAVDDGSIDESPALLAGWTARDPRFTVLRKSSSGIVDALNAGLAVATAPVIARMDGDDLSVPGRFAEQHAYLQAHPGCVAVGCAVDHIDSQGRPLHGLPQPGQPEDADALRLPAREPYIVHPFLMARTVAMRVAGGYRHVPHSEDSDLCWRLAEQGSLHNLPARLGRYRMHLDSISGSSILNGRTMAVGSQLAAISAQRRRARQPDLVFDRNLIGELRQAVLLDMMCIIVSRTLKPEEVPTFRLAVGIKLLELANYRPYELESSDCTFISAALEPAYYSTSQPNQRDIDYFLSRSGSRLLRKQRMRDAARLVPRRLWRWTGMKAVLLR